MSTKELLIEEINHTPEDILQQLLSYLRAELARRNKSQNTSLQPATGPYADYWNQFIGTFANQEWERPSQGTLTELLSYSS